MGANITPIFPLSPNIGFGTVITADNHYTTPITNSVIIFTAGKYGSKIDQIIARPLGTNIQSVLRLFINDGAGVAADNFALIHEVMLPASTAANDNVAGDGEDIILYKDGDNKTLSPIPYLPEGYKIYAALGKSVAAGWKVIVHGSDYGTEDEDVEEAATAGVTFTVTEW